MIELHVHDQLTIAIRAARETLAEAFEQKLRLSLAEHVDVVAVFALDGPYVGKAWPEEDRSQLRPSEYRRSDDGCPHRVVYRLAWPDSVRQAGGPYMQQQALLRAKSSRLGHA